MAVRRARACALLLATVLLGLASPAFPCGPFFPQAVFTFTRHPDLPLENFLRGQLGIVLPTYSRSYLYLSYCILGRQAIQPRAARGSGRCLDSAQAIGRVRCATESAKAAELDQAMG